MNTKNSHWLPEILDNVALYLNNKELFTCHLVSKQWYEQFLPYLWHTIDDKNYTWPNITPYYNDINKTIQEIRNDGGIIQAFCKHGHLIRHLRIYHRVLVDVAFLAGTCTNILSIEVFPLHEWKEPVVPTTTSLTTTSSTTTSTTTVDDKPHYKRPLLSPIFQGALKRDPSLNRRDEEKENDFLTIQRFWLLVQQNQHGIRKLRLDSYLQRLAQLVSVDFLRDIIIAIAGRHGQLRELDNGFPKINEGMFIDQLPKLRKLKTVAFFSHVGSFGGDSDNNIPPIPHWTITEPLQLRSLHVTAPIMLRLVFIFLNRLPGLSTLRVTLLHRQISDLLTDKDVFTIMDGTPSSLQSLNIFLANDYRTVARHIPPWLPQLRKLTYRELVADTAKDLVRLCPLLEEFRDVNDGISIDPTAGKPEMNVLGILLRGCANLKVIDAIQHRIEATEVVRYPWAATKLEIFRMQIVGVSRLTKDREGNLIRAMMAEAGGAGMDVHEDAMFRDHQQSLEQQRQVLERLASLTRLRVLDIGFEYRRTRLHFVNASVAPMEMFQGKKYRAYGGPIPDTLALTLESGLAQLARLKALEVFGFGGVDHHIEEGELKWMADSWPKLRVMRGLKFAELKEARPERRRDALREYMVSIRPDVQHEFVS
ncbi:MAG: hypothetical protein JOS17DRAFT_793763 [Linnemannia elongata]|nr:MAG: hypothetical protein JOS17DRAFT_793763 [Linnemannia elongata]